MLETKYVDDEFDYHIDTNISVAVKCSLNFRL